jgi:predicted DNA-binding protein (UPF0251 family)
MAESIKTNKIFKILPKNPSVLGVFPCLSGGRIIMTRRVITERQEEAYRLVCPDFKGLSVKAAAKIMGVTPRQIWWLLQRVREKAPQLFVRPGRDQRPDKIIKYDKSMDNKVVRKF